jgi:hypothetical protein
MTVTYLTYPNQSAGVARPLIPRRYRVLALPDPLLDRARWL